jgi:hypothetical protein
MANYVDQGGACCEFPADGGTRNTVVIPDGPTDFPGAAHSWLSGAIGSPLLWALLYLLALMLLYWIVYNVSKKSVVERRALWIGYKPDLGLGRRLKLWEGRKSYLDGDRKLTGAEWLWKHVNATLHKAWSASPDEKQELAQKALDVYEGSMRNTLTLSRALGKAMGDLNKAVEGQKEVDPPKSGPAFSSTGTVINIAVNQGNTVTAQGDASQANSATTPHDGEPSKAAEKPAEEPMSESDQRKAIWGAVDKLYALWKNEMQIMALFMQAQKQLTRADSFAWPEDEQKSPGMLNVFTGVWKSATPAAAKSEAAKPDAHKQGG